MTHLLDLESSLVFKFDLFFEFLLDLCDVVLETANSGDPVLFVLLRIVHQTIDILGLVVLERMLAPIVNGVYATYVFLALLRQVGKLGEEVDNCLLLPIPRLFHCRVLGF